MARARPCLQSPVLSSASSKWKPDVDARANHSVSWETSSFSASPIGCIAREQNCDGQPIPQSYRSAPMQQSPKCCPHPVHLACKPLQEAGTPAERSSGHLQSWHPMPAALKTWENVLTRGWAGHVLPTQSFEREPQDATSSSGHLALSWEPHQSTHPSIDS